MDLLKFDKCWKRGSTSFLVFRRFLLLDRNKICRRSSHPSSNYKMSRHVLASDLSKPRVFLTPLRCNVRASANFNVSFPHLNSQRATNSDNSPVSISISEDVIQDELLGKESLLDAPSQGTKTDEAMVLFELVFNGLVQEKKLENMIFPKCIMWLSGAPGSGKSEMTDFIMRTQEIETRPINVGSLLKDELCENLKSRGHLVNDRKVITALLRRLLEPEYNGRNVLVDGFPRTPTQAQCISLLYDKMLVLRRQFEKTELFTRFPRPVFHVTVLYVDEKVSVERQLQRGTKGVERNKKVKITGIGTEFKIRETDLDEAKARIRYAEFHSQIYNSLQLIRKNFHFILLMPKDHAKRLKNRLKPNWLINPTQN